MVGRSAYASHTRRTLGWGLTAAVLSAAGTYGYFLSILLYPVLIAMSLAARRHYGGVPQPKPREAIYGLWLAVTALLMPPAGLVGFLTMTSTPSPIDLGPIQLAPAYRAILPPMMLVFFLSLLVTVRIRRKTRMADG